MLINPKVEYRSQVTVITEKECNSLFSPFRRIFKNKLRLSSTTPNAILECNLIYNIKNFIDLQLQSKITNFFIQINDQSLLGQITRLRLNNIQSFFCLEKSPLCNFPFTQLQISTTRYKNNFLIKNLLLLQSRNFSISINSEFENNISGGKITLRELLGNDIFFKNLHSFRKNNLIYLNQVSQISGKYLCQWNTIIRRSFISDFQYFPIPSWFNQIEHITTNSDREIKIEYIENFSFHMKGTSLTPLSTDQLFNKSHFVIFWNTNLQCIEVGRLKKHLINNQQTDIVLLEHYILIENNNSLHSFTIQPCRGCNLNNLDSQQRDMKNFRCSMLFNKHFGIKLIYPSKISDNTYLFKNYSWFDLIDIIYHHHSFITNTIQYTSNFSVSQTINTDNLIIKYVDYGLDRNKLLNIQNQIQQQTLIQPVEFYTDGSLRNFQTDFCEMSFGFILVENNNILHTFTSSTEHYPSLTKAEIYGLLSVVLVIPKNYSIKIYTDSQNIIFGYYSHIHNNNFDISPRKFFKISSFNIEWNVIMEIIKSKNLTIEFQKVTAHSNNYFNNTIDQLVKNTDYSSTFLSIKENQFNNILFCPRWNNILIDKNLRRFIRQTCYITGLENF